MKSTVQQNDCKHLWSIGLIVTLAGLTLMAALASPPQQASASASQAFGPACGAATLDGVIDADEWSSASTLTFLMIPASADPLTATLYVMNSGYYLYLGITINDDEFTPAGQWLPRGDVFRIDFDNDHSGSLLTLHDDVLNIAAGLPQFSDNHLYDEQNPAASDLDVNHGGTSDGSGAASRVANLNHFELRHPLCSGDTLDFCLQPGGVIGFHLEYLDTEGYGSEPDSQFYPGPGVTDIADIHIGACTAADQMVYLPLIQK
jgi:hypothetical protein